MNTREINRIIKEEERFLEQIRFTLFLLKAYKNNPKEFFLLIGESLKKRYFWKKKMSLLQIWDFLEELSGDISNRYIHVHFKENGVFPVLEIKKKSGLKITTIMERLKGCDNQEWRI